MVEEPLNSGQEAGFERPKSRERAEECHGGRFREDLETKRGLVVPWFPVIRFPYVPFNHWHGTRLYRVLLKGLLKN